MSDQTRPRESVAPGQARNGRAGNRRGRNGRVLNVTLWVLQAVLAVSFCSSGVLKLLGTPVMTDLFADIGAGQWLRYLVGAVEVAGGLGVVTPRLSGLAALGLGALMLGAITTNLLIIDAAVPVPVTYLVLAAGVAWGRWPQTRALAAVLRR